MKIGNQGLLSNFPGYSFEHPDRLLDLGLNPEGRVRMRDARTHRIQPRYCGLDSCLVLRQKLATRKTDLLSRYYLPPL